MSSRPQRSFEPDPVQADESNKTVIRVRRGALRRFDQLKTKSVHLPVEVKWDRRTTERRTEAEDPGAERREGERRQRPPFTWNAADFVIEGDRSQPNPAPDATAPGRRRK